MTRKNCPTCGLVNFLDAVRCKRCDGELTSSEVKPQSNVGFGVPVVNIQGFGVSLIDYKATHDGRFEAMKWLVLINFAIVPLSAWIIEPLEAESEIPGMHTRYSFNAVERTSLKLGRVLRIWALNTISIAPLILAFPYSTSVAEKITSEWYFELATVYIFAAIGWLIWIQRKYSHNGFGQYTLKESH